MSKLSSEPDVSEVTIRKDLQVLDDRNLLVRTHGGAALMDRYLYYLPFDENPVCALRKKDASVKGGVAGTGCPNAGDECG